MLSKYDIASISRGISKGDFDPEGARNLLEEFKRQADETNYLSVSREMLIHINSAIGRYLEGACTLDQAFGLVARGAGRTKKSTREATADAQLDAAVRCLVQRVSDDITFENACEKVAEEIGISDEFVRSAWRKHSKPAVWLFRARHKDLTDAQKGRLIRVCKTIFPDLSQWPPAD
jgi:hypothetical protein